MITCLVSIPEKKVRHEYEIDLIDLKQFLLTEDIALKANAAGYIQHLCYNDENIKAKIRCVFSVALIQIIAPSHMFGKLLHFSISL